MIAVEKTRKKRVFLANSRAKIAGVQEALDRLGLDSVTLDEAAIPGTSWVESLQECVNDADVVIGIIDDPAAASNVYFELGMASALNKPTLLLISAEFPTSLVPPSGIPFLRMDLRNDAAVTFGLKQVLSLSPRDRKQLRVSGFSTRPIGPVADELLARLPATDAREFEDLVHEAINASGGSIVARGDRESNMDFAVWSSDFEPTIANPLLIECKSVLRSQSDINETIGRMFRALEALPNGCGIVLKGTASRTIMPSRSRFPFTSSRPRLSSKDCVASVSRSSSARFAARHCTGEIDGGIRLGRHRRFLAVVDEAATNAAKGKAFEDLACYLLEGVPGVRITVRNESNTFATEEIDVACLNQSDPEGLGSLMDFFLVECKGWKDAVTSEQVAWFLTKSRHRGMRFGILIAANGITGEPEHLSRANFLVSAELASFGIKMVIVTRQEIEQLSSGEQFARLIIRKICTLHASGGRCY